ncbi:hypothetical protein BDD14_6688 [Edaphobacter modestus]|uniref:Uncharacterized protein n=1 Tax=Edaphobacter modestus TaxID=388466 RepID=A0A4Q7XZ65_9BACT|nr:hypothetical protein BDD14_6688 [Edaphobacter modestus]
MPEPTIKSARITPMPKGPFDSMPEVFAVFTDGEERRLFSFYPDEISFAPVEFVGLTEREACVLRHRRDVAYLRS